MRKLLFFALVGAAIYLYFRAKRALVLFTLDIEGGRIVKSSGRVPPRLLADVADVVERSQLDRIRVEAYVRGGRPVLRFSGELEEGTAQRIRNVVGQFSAQDIRGSRGAGGL